MRHSPLVARAIEVAEKKLGMDELCRRIHVTPESLHAWRYGLASIPQRKFLQLVDVLTDLDPSWKEWDEPDSGTGTKSSPPRDADN